MRLSIIVPVYNVEQYIRPCLESVVRQELDDADYEIIIVNDGTKDRSMEMVNDIIQQHENIIVINQENQGLSVARNTGLKHAGGEYVLFVDSDDLLVNNSLLLLLQSALKSSADIVIADFVKMTDKDIGESSNYVFDSSIQSTMLHGSDAFLKCLKPNQCFVWRSLYRRKFLEDYDLKFIPGLFFEDVPFTVECYLKTKCSLWCPIPLYIYRQHPDSIVSTINKKKLLDLNKVIAYLFSIRNSLCFSKEEHNKLFDMAFSTFSVEIWYLTHETKLFDYRKDIVRDLKERVPDLFFGNGFKQYLTSMFFRWMPYTYLKIRYLLGK